MKSSLKCILLSLIHLFLVTSVNATQIAKGWLDMTNNTYIGNNIIKLNGDWEFYFNKTYSQVQNEKLTPTFIKVPGVWNDFGFPARGFAVYRAHIIINSSLDNLLAIKPFTISTAYNLYVNGQLVGSEGRFDTAETNYVPNFQPQYFVFKPKSDTLEIAFEVANFEYRKGGIWFHVNLSSPSSILAKTQLNLMVSAFLIGAMIIMFFYQLGFYFIRRNDKTPLYFGLICLMAALRICTTGEILIRYINLPLSWDWLVRFEYISLFMLIGFGAMYIRCFFPRDVNWGAINFIYYFNILLSGFVIISPIRISSFIIAPYLVLVVFQLLYFFISLILALKNKRNHANLMVSGYLILFFTGINDILYSQELIDSIFLAPVGVLLFIFLQGFAISRKYSIAFQTVDELNAKLMESNSTLQRKVEERTINLNEQKEYLEHVGTVKDKMFSIISHDLRGPLKSLVNVLHWIEDDELSFDEAKKFLKGIKRNLDNMILTLENMLQWSRSQLGGLQTNQEAIDIREIVNESIGLYLPIAQEKKIQISNEIAERMIAFIDPNHLSLLVRNLLSNAIKFSNEGGVVRIQAFYADEKHLVISVRDSGIGIPKDKIGQLLDDRTHYTTYGTAKEKGTGLGLMICKEFVESNGGSIQIESIENVGTTIYLKILRLE